MGASSRRDRRRVGDIPDGRSATHSGNARIRRCAGQRPPPVPWPPRAWAPRRWPPCHRGVPRPAPHAGMAPSPEHRHVPSGLAHRLVGSGGGASVRRHHGAPAGNLSAGGRHRGRSGIRTCTCASRTRPIPPTGDLGATLPPWAAGAGRQQPSPSYSGRGELLGWFFLMQDAGEVDGVRVTAGDGSVDSTRPIATWPLHARKPRGVRACARSRSG